MRKQLRKKWFARLLFFAYFGVLLYFLFFSERYGRTEPYTELHYNLQPFREINRYLRHADAFSFELFTVNILGNIIAFMPFGFLLPLAFPRPKYEFWVLMCITYLVVLTMECIQLFTMVGSFDVDDIILNSFGSAVGFFVYRMVMRKR